MANNLDHPESDIDQIVLSERTQDRLRQSS
jgi:hypothetical protein